jgi:hypothetical protein
MNVCLKARDSQANLQTLIPDSDSVSKLIHYHALSRLPQG